MKIVTFGEIMLRLSKHAGQRLFQNGPFDAAYGGSEANVAVSLAQLAARMHLRELGLDVHHSVRGGKRLGSYYFEPSVAMRGSRVVYDRDESAFNTMAYGDINWEPVFREAHLFHCSGITCATSRDALDTTMEAVRMADERGLELTCDINYRGNLWKYPGANAQQSLCELMSHSSFIFGDQNEWKVASGMEPIPFTALGEDYTFDQEAYRRYFDRLHTMFPRCHRMLMAHRNILSSQHHVNCGVLWVDGDIYYSRIYDIDDIVDQMGVGDAWVAAYIHARLKWPEDEQRCLDFSVSASALKNTISGDQNLVSEQEILANMTARGGRIDR